jgi:hypothetical protein
VEKYFSKTSILQVLIYQSVYFSAVDIFRWLCKKPSEIITRIDFRKGQTDNQEGFGVYERVA